MAKELKTILGMDTKPFSNGMRSASRKTAQFNRNIGAPLVKGAKNMAMIGIAAGAAALGIASIATNKVANLGDELDKTSKKTGLSVEELARYKHAAELSGASLDSLRKGMKAMALLTYEAGRGTKTYTDVLDTLGLSYDDIKGKSPDVQLSTFLTAIADIKDPTLKAAMAVKVFGRAGVDLLPMLAGGADGLKNMKAEADKFGIVLTKEQVDAAVEFKDNILKVKKAILGLAISVISFDKINAVIKMMIEKVVALRNSAAFPQFVNTLKTGAISIVEHVGTVIKTMWNLGKAIHGSSKVILPVIAGVALAFKTGLAVPLLKLSGMLIKGLFTTLVGPLGGILLAVMGIFAAFKLGEALEKSFDLSTIIAKELIKLQGFGAKIKAWFTSIGPGFSEEFAKASESIDKDVSNRLGMLGPPEGNGKSVGENFMDGMKQSFVDGKAKIGGLLEKIMPKEFMEAGKFKLPEMPEIKVALGKLGSGDDGVANGVENGMARAFSKQSGINKIFGGGTQTEAMKAGERSRIAQQQLAQNKRTNTLLDHILRQEAIVF